MADQTSFDVLVIGAGAAGIAAAHALSAAGLSLAVLEARPRIGGRIFTLRPPGAERPLELGAEFVQGRSPPLLAIVERAGLALCERAGVDWSSDARHLQPPDDNDRDDGDVSADQFDVFFEAIKTWQGDDLALRAFLEQRFPGDAWDALREMALGYAQGYQAADPDDVSIRWLVRDEAGSEASEGDRQFRVLAGYDRVLEWLRSGLDPACVTFHLATPVAEIRWSPGQVEAATVAPASGAASTFSARAAIITLPLGVLNAPDGAVGAVRFVPEIAEKRAQLAGLRMGHTAKVVLRFSDVFWDRVGATTPQMPRLSFLFSDRDDFPTWWTNYPIVEPVLTGWMGGPRAAALATESDDVIAERALAALAGALHVRRATVEAHLRSWHLHNWSADPFSRGAYSYVRVGGLQSLELAGLPIAETLFFAGEATAPAGQSAVVHGAIATGQRAAADVLRHLAAQE